MVYRPDPAAQVGTYDTTDTAGTSARFGKIEDTAPVFALSRAADLAWALRAMDVEDTEVPQNLVQTSPGLTVNRGDPDEDRRRITEAAARNRQQLERMGYTFTDRGIPVAPPDGGGQNWRNMAASLGPMVDIPHEPTGPAG